MSYVASPLEASVKKYRNLSDKKVLGVVEIVALISCAYFGYQWVKYPEGNYEPALYLGGLSFIALEILRRYEVRLIKREGKSFTPGELIKHSQELKKIFETEIIKCRRNNLIKDAIIRHVNRLDSYPNVDPDSKGISPWFRVGLLDTYHKGIYVALKSCTLSEGPDGWRYTNYKENEKGDIKVYMIGKIPYEFIEDVDLDGDEYYYLPHIYCHFANKGEPYAEIVFCEEVDMGHAHLYYREIATYKEVSENSARWGGEYFA